MKLLTGLTVECLSAKSCHFYSESLFILYRFTGFVSKAEENIVAL